MAYSSEFTKQVLANKKNNTQNVENYESDYTKSVLNKSYTPSTTIDINTIRNEQIKNNMNKNNEKEDKSILKTASAGLQYLGQGALKGVEAAFVDTPLILAAGTRKLFGDEEGAKGLMDASNVSLTNMLINKAAGEETNPFINNNQNLWNKEVDKNSYIKENNLGGQIVTGIGEMLPTMALTGGISGGQKAQKIGANILLGTKAFSSGTNEAYQDSGDIGKSMLYGLSSAGTELLTEQISGGIPGLKQINGTTKKEIAKNYLKSVIGEGTEEIMSSLANPLLQTLYKGPDSLNQYKDLEYWKEVGKSGVAGAAIGGILDSPNTINSLKGSNINLNNQDLSQNKANINQVDQNIETLPKYSEMGENNTKIINYTGDSNLQFSEQVDKWKNGKFNKNAHLIVSKETPKIYQDLGLDNLEMTIVANKLDRIYNSSGKQKGSYHGLGELVKELPEALANPLNVVESTTDSNSIVVVTRLGDMNDNIVVVSIKPNGNGQIEIENISKNVPANVLTSAYGKENYDYQLKPRKDGMYTGWMEDNAKNDRIIYDIDEGIKKQRVNGQWVSFPNSNNSFSEDNIPQSDNSVKLDILPKYSMQNNQNNTQELDNSPFSLVNANGKKYLYDILNIKPQKKLANLPSVASNSNKSSAMIDGSSNQFANNILQFNNNVKSDSLPKYSMQKSENNTLINQKKNSATALHDNNPGLNTSETDSGTSSYTYDNSINVLNSQIAQSSNNSDIQNIENNTSSKKKTLNPTEISKLVSGNAKQEVEIKPTQDILKATSDSLKVEPTSNSQKEIKENKTASLLENRPLEKQKGLKSEVNKLYQQIVDKGKYVADLAKKTGNKELYAKYDQMGTARGTAEYSIGVEQVDNNGKRIGKSLIDIWKPITDSGKEFDFSMYLLHKHNIDRYTQGKPVFGEDITAEISKQEVERYEKENPQFKEYSKDINAYNKNLLQNMVDAGLTSEESQKYYNETYSNYVRIYRDITGNNPIQITSNGLKINSPIKKAKGGNQDILPLKDSMAQQTLEVTNAIRRNQFGLELLKTLGNGEAVTEYGNEIISKNEDGTFSFTVFENGNPVKMTIDEGLYESIKPTKRGEWENLLPVKGARKLLSFQRGLITDKNPLFLFRNFFKDLGDAPLNSKYSSKFIKNFPRAYYEIANNGDYARLYKALGGYQQSYFDNDTGLRFPSQKKSAKFIKNIQSLNQAIEMAPRLAEFISSIESGDTIQTAMYNAAEITTNFKRGGDITKAVNRNFSNFLNASVQGFDKQFRNLTGQNGFKGYTNLLLKTMVWGVLPSVLNHLLLGDDDEYEELPEYIKDNYYLFKTSDNNFIRIPKGRVVSVFGNAARRTIEYVNGDKDACKGYLSNVVTNIAPNNPIGSNVLSPFIQVATNKSWNGSDIVPSRLKNLPRGEQFDEKTDEISKWIGSTFNISPKKVNYLLDQYSGAIGDVLLPALTPQAEQNPFTSAFSVNSITTNRYSGEFYDLKDELLEKANSVKATTSDVLKNKYINSIQQEINELYKEKREIQMSSMKDNEKRKAIQKIQKQINEISKSALTDYKKEKSFSNYGYVNDTAYYLNNKNEWTKVKDEELEELDKLTLTDKQKNNYFKIKVQVGTIHSNKNKSNNERHKEIANTIINSSLEDKTKSYLYSKYYSSEKELKTISLLKIDINEFIKYDSQDFESDYNDKGVIANSKKNKVATYINSLDLSKTQKAILFKMQYNSYNSNNGEILNYINNLSLSKYEKSALAKKIGFTGYDNYLVSYITSLNIPKNEKIKQLEDLGFTVRNDKIYK